MAYIGSYSSSWWFNVNNNVWELNPQSNDDLSAIETIKVSYGEDLFQTILYRVVELLVLTADDVFVVYDVQDKENKVDIKYEYFKSLL